MIVGYASIVSPYPGGRLDSFHVLSQCHVSIAHDRASRVEHMNKASATSAWLVSLHLVVNGVIGEIEVAAQDPRGRLYSAAAPVIERHQASKSEHIRQHGILAA